MRRSTIYLPLAFGAVLSAGIWIGNRFPGNMSGSSGYNGYDKINAVLGIVEDRYVDSVDRQKLIDETITDLLQSLDPHSYYYTADELRESNEPLQGNFEGIGIEYRVFHDTITVLRAIPGGPSENILFTGDRLVKADGVSLTGIDDKTHGKLRGTAGSKVLVSVRRPGVKGLVDREITRDNIPIYSIDAAYLLDATTGYVKLSRFAENSHAEFKRAVDSLRKAGMKNLVFDLRDNGGGYLHTAVELADEFLPAGQKIVYTVGRTTGREDHNATSKGNYENMPLVLLIDENSASASEIIAGAIQDNDRGTLVGRRSFGKGLVQEEKMLADSSGFRITVSRYYTPSGRCIQKPYENGSKAYYAENNRRYARGELLNADSIRFPDSLKYQTIFKKRTVYGGGGIMPDIFVPLDTAGMPQLIDKLYAKDVFNFYAMNYVTVNRGNLEKQGLKTFLRDFTVSPEMMSDFRKTAASEKCELSAGQLERYEGLLHMYIKAYVAQLIWSDEAFLMVINSNDKEVQRAAASFGRK